jgi:hypothetical protein
MERIEKREAAIRRVEAAARELRDAQQELAELTESADELTALVLYGETRPRVRFIDAGPNPTSA